MRAKKTNRTRAIVKSKAKPEIYVRIKGRYEWSGSTYAHAHIRIKGGEYQYLQWRDGGRVCSLYLGRKRKS